MKLLMVGAVSFAVSLAMACPAAADPLQDLLTQADKDVAAQKKLLDDTRKSYDDATKTLNGAPEQLAYGQAFSTQLDAAAQANAAFAQARDAQAKQADAAAKEAKARAEEIAKAAANLASKQYQIKDAWLRGKVKADWVNYGDIFAILKGTLADKPIDLSMAWPLQDTPGNIERLGRALLSATYSAKGVSDLNLDFLKPKPWVMFSCGQGGMALAVKDRIAKLEAPVVAWAFSGGEEAERWYLNDDHTIATSLENQQNLVLDLALTTEQSQSKDLLPSGLALKLMPHGDSLSQRWSVNNMPNGSVVLVNDMTGDVLDCGANPANGQPVLTARLGTNSPSPSQTWKEAKLSLKEQQ